MSVGGSTFFPPNKPRSLQMLIPTKTGFLEIVKEPQFEDIYTVQATDLDSIRLMRKHTQARSVLNDYSRTYRFFTYAYPEDIATALKMPIKSSDIDTLDKNISPAPVGYQVLGFWHDKGDDIQAEVLAEELEQFRYETDFHFDEFRAWPLFHMTDELVEQKNRAA
jgi:hypothetical protein